MSAALTRFALLLTLAIAGCAKDAPDSPPRAEPAKAPPAPVAPTAAQRELLGIVVGETLVEAARAEVERRGFACEDASLSAVMAKAHAQHGVTVPAPAPGAPAVAIPGMPAGHDKYLRDPRMQQVRITCADVPLAALADGRDAPAGQTARLLLVADRSAGPVTLVALQRTHKDGAVAAADARATLAALERRYGAAAEQRGEAPAVGARLALMSPVSRNWQFTGLAVEATAVDLGKTGISVSEQLAVP